MTVLFVGDWTDKPDLRTYLNPSLSNQRIYLLTDVDYSHVNTTADESWAIHLTNTLSVFNAVRKIEPNFVFVDMRDPVQATLEDTLDGLEMETSKLRNVLYALRKLRPSAQVVVRNHSLDAQQLSHSLARFLVTSAESITIHFLL